MFLPFEYYDPRSLAEFVSLSKKLDDYRILAGGTDLLVKMRNGWKPCDAVVDIKRIADIPELHAIQEKEEGMKIGALVDFTTIKEHPGILQHFAALHQAASLMGCLEIRNRATLGGNIGNAGSGAEGGSTLLALNARVHIAGKNGKRDAALQDFYGLVSHENGRMLPGVTLQKGELVTHFTLPFLPADSASIYVRRARTKGMDLASLNLAVVVCSKSNPAQRSFRIAGGALGPLPFRFNELEKRLQGAIITPQLLEEAKQELEKRSTPRPTSKRAPADYKKDQAGELFELALQKLGIDQTCAEGVS